MERIVPLFVLRTRDVGNTRFRSVNVDGMVSFLSVKTDFKAGVIASIRRDLGTIKRQDVIDNSLNGLLRKIRIINAEIVVKPAGLHTRTRQPAVTIGWEENLILDQVCGDKPFGSQKRNDIAELFLLAGKPSVGIASLFTNLVIGLASKGDVRCDGRARTGGARRRATG